MRSLIIITSTALALTALSCSHMKPDISAEAPADMLHAKALSQTMAETRAQLVHDVKYELQINLDKTQDSYSGVQKINFQLAKLQGDLPLDFRDGEIQSLVINGATIENSEIQRGPIFVRLAEKNLHLDENTIEVHFTHPFSHNGTGLHRFVDNEDKNVYLYTHFEPFDANRFAPFFDQPDLKATMTMTVNAPADWVVITNTNEASHSKGQWQFNTTPKLSTYLFALVAGPYTMFDGHYKDKKMRLFARKTMAKYVEPKEWLKVTEQGLNFYENYFGIPYPYEKFDQIIVPEFNSGAMENAGAITFTERFIHRNGYTRPNHVVQAFVILHEMAHQWFGDLVTMRWWNDLWLNESFADAMGLVATVGATEYKEAPISFLDRKMGGEREDEMITTHPISSTINDTVAAHTNFDGITYSKGAAVIRELYFYVGDENFRKALHYYFTQHAYQNTTLNDFIAAFNETLHTDMSDWFKTWLTTTGIDQIETNFTCNADGVTVHIHNLSSTLRVHTLKIGRYRWEHGKVVFDGADEYRVTAKEGDLNIPKPAACPQMIYANVDDQAYVRLQLDKKTVEFLQAHINEIPDQMTRQLAWADLWQMVRDQKFRLADFSAMAMRALQIETNLDILKALAAETVGFSSEFDNAYYYMPRSTDEEKRELTDLKRNFAQVLWSRLTHEAKGSDFEKMFTDFYLRAADDPAQLERLQKMTKTLKDQDRRWQLLNTLCRLGAKDCEQRVDIELKHDHSDLAQKSAIGCRAVRPDIEVKREYLKQLAGEKSPFSLDVTRTISNNLFPAFERNLISNFTDEIYKDFSTVWVPKRDEDYHVALARRLAPIFCERRANIQLENVLQGEGANWPTTYRKTLLQEWDQDSRCIKVRRYNANPAPMKYET